VILAKASTQLIRSLTAVIDQAHGLEHGRRAAATLLRAHAQHEQGVFNVFVCREHRDQAEVLKNEADLLCAKV